MQILLSIGHFAIKPHKWGGGCKRQSIGGAAGAPHTGHGIEGDGREGGLWQPSHSGLWHSRNMAAFCIQFSLIKCCVLVSDLYSNRLPYNIPPLQQTEKRSQEEGNIPEARSIFSNMMRRL